MTLRGYKNEKREAERFRSQRITKLLERGWIKDPDEVPIDAVPVDPDLINLGGSWHRPLFFRDQPFTCRDCGEECLWKAVDQRWYFETTQAPYYQTAIRCRACRAKVSAGKVEARRRSGHQTE